MRKSKQSERVERKLENLCRELDALGIEYSYDQFVDVFEGKVLPGSHTFTITCKSQYRETFLYPSAIQFSVYLRVDEGKLFSTFRDFRINVPSKLQKIEDKPHSSIHRLRDIAYNESDRLLV